MTSKIEIPFSVLRNSLKVTLVLIALAWLNALPSCKKETVLPLNLISMKVGDKDLSTTATEIPVNIPIAVTFSTNIDPLTVSDSSVVMTRDYDLAPVPLTLIASGSVLSIRSTTDLISGAFYTLVITSELKSTHGDPFGSVTTGFKTAGRFVPSNLVSYWSFENSPNDVVGTYDPISTNDVIIEYTDGRNDSSRQAALFDGTTSVIQIANGAALLKPEFTMSFWTYVDSDNHTDAAGNQKGNFVIGIGNAHGLQFEVDANYAWCRFSQGLLLTDLTTRSNDFQFNADGITKDNVQSLPDSIADGIENATVFNQSFGPAGIRQRLDKVWAQVTMTFDDSTRTRTLYINGEKMIQQDLGLLANPAIAIDPALRPLATVTSLTFIPDSEIPARYDDKLVFGFWQNKEATFGGDSEIYSNVNANHFKGKLDDVRFFNRALTPTEVSLMYEGER